MNVDYREKPILEMQDIVKEFSGVYALSGITFDLYRSEIHCLVGENGAGKSTLIKAPDRQGTRNLYYLRSKGRLFFPGPGHPGPEENRAGKCVGGCGLSPAYLPGRPVQPLYDKGRYV